jgi:hypothetical protein
MKEWIRRLDQKNWYIIIIIDNLNFDGIPRITSRNGAKIPRMCFNVQSNPILITITRLNITHGNHNFVGRRDIIFWFHVLEPETLWRQAWDWVI